MSFLSVNKSFSISFPSSPDFFNFSISIVNFFLLYCFFFVWFLICFSLLWIFLSFTFQILFIFNSIFCAICYFFCLVFWNEELSLFIFHFNSIHYFFLSTSISLCLFLFLYLSKYKLNWEESSVTLFLSASYISSKTSSITHHTSCILKISLDVWLFSFDPLTLDITVICLFFTSHWIKTNVCVYFLFLNNIINSF